MRRQLAIGGLALALTGCGGESPASNEDLARAICHAALAERLDPPRGEYAAQTQMIGRRDYGWLVRGLSAAGQQGPQNYECALRQPASGPPTLTYVRLCEAGDSPWGCPEGPR